MVISSSWEKSSHTIKDDCGWFGVFDYRAGKKTE